MTNKEQVILSQGMIWAIIVAVVLVGIGLIGVLFCKITNYCGGGSISTPTITARGIDTPIPTATSTVTILAIKSQAKLSIIKYPAVAEIRKENLPQNLIDKFFNRKEQLLMLVYGSVEAGFDLQELKEEDLWTDGKRVRLVLPSPKILNTTIDLEHTHTVYYENNLLLSENNPDLQKDALAEAKKAIEQKSLEFGILQNANTYGKLYYENFLRSLGFTEVEVVTDAQIFKK